MRSWFAARRDVVPSCATQGNGQALVEFALVIPVFLLVLFGLVDVGRLVYTNSVLSQAAREGARVASVEASWVGSSDPRCGQAGGPTCPTDASHLIADVRSAANRMVTGVGTITDVYIQCDPAAGTPPAGSWTTSSSTTGCAAVTASTPTATGDLISVRVAFAFVPITPIVGQLISDITLSGSATMVID